MQLPQEPQDVTLTQLVTPLALLEQVHRKQIEARDARIKILEEQVRLLRTEKFGASSEKHSSDQIPLLFNEAESLVAAAPQDVPASIVIPEHARKARGHRTALSAELPRVEIIHDLPDSEKVCARDGATLIRIGEETSEQLDYVPAIVRVLKHIRLKYGCPCCEQTVKTATRPAQILPKSNATPSLLAHIVTAKYVDGLPLYRQETQFARLGVNLPRVTSARWMIMIGIDKVVPLINLMNDYCVAQPLIHLDETPLQVLKSDKAPQSDHYLWVRCAGPPQQRIVLFDYDPSRSKAVPTRLLPDYRGAILTDGYEGYTAVASDQHLLHAGCWAHVRRKFDEARKVASHATIERNRSDEMLALIRQLYGIERALNDQHADDAERLATRTHKAAPIIEQIKQWVDTQRPHVLPQSLLGKALTYTHNQWPKLTVFLNHANIPLDNNRAENAIRPFVIGRKNWLFCDTVAGAQASANLYSLIETAKANGLEPHAYLTRLFTELPSAQTVADIEKLLPFKKL